MKTILKFAILIILLNACEDNTGIKIIKPVNGVYPSIRDLNRIESIIVSDEVIGTIQSDLKKVTESLQSDDEKIKSNFVLYINEQGKIETVLVLESNNSNLADMLSPFMKNWSFEVIQQNSIPQKYRFEWMFTLQKNSEDIFELVSTNLPIPLERNGEQYYTSVEEMPEPIGGIPAIQEKVHYPEIAKQAGIQGRVFVKTLVNKEGIVVDTEIIRGIEGGCNESAMAAVKATRFKPARLKGEPVNAQVIVPILFRLQ